LISVLIARYVYGARPKQEGLRIDTRGVADFGFQLLFRSYIGTSVLIANKYVHMHMFVAETGVMKA